MDLSLPASCTEFFAGCSCTWGESRSILINKTKRTYFFSDVQNGKAVKSITRNYGKTASEHLREITSTIGEFRKYPPGDERGAHLRYVRIFRFR